jgi:hypothetical protein
MSYLVSFLAKIKILLFSVATTSQSVPTESGFLADLKAGQLLSSIVYTLIGIAFFALTFWVITKVSPFSMRKEIEEDQNISLGIIIGSIFLGIAIIIAAAIH